MGDTINSIFRNIISLLRYFFPPIIGFLIVFVGYECKPDENNVYYKLVTNHVSLTILVTFALGLTIFHIHLATIHYILEFLIMSAVRKSFREPKIRKLNFARWIRRCPVGEKDYDLTKKAVEAHAIQNTLNIANAGVHLLYCSCWSALMWWVVFSYSSYYLTENKLPCSAWYVIVGLFLAAIANEFWTSFYDLEVYNKYNKDTDEKN